MSPTDQAAQWFDRAIEEHGVRLLLRPRSGSAVVADLVGGSDPSLYRASRVLEVGSELLADGVDIADLERELRAVATDRGVDPDLSGWGAEQWSRALERLESDPPGSPTEDPGSQDPAPTRTRRRARVVVQVAMICVLIVVLLVAITVASPG